jgi:Glyoxalase-like domain
MAPFGQAVRARSEQGGGWLGWVVSTGNLERVEQRLGRSAVDGNRHLPDGRELKWKQIGVMDLMKDPQLPFIIHWLDYDRDHPSQGASGNLHLDALEIAGDPSRVSEWLGQPVEGPLEDVKVEWVAPHGTPGVTAAQFSTPDGLVRI